MPLPRITCPRCSLAVAMRSHDSSYHRVRLHNCPHGRRCIGEPAEKDYSAFSHATAARLREIAAWSREQERANGHVPCPECAATRAAKLSKPAFVARPAHGSVSLVTSRSAASTMPGLRIGEVRPAGGDLVSVSVPSFAVDHLVTGQRLVRYRPKRARSCAASQSASC